uniref:Bromodomain associated domain-containing protein n=2 Tax=Clastoptera arizonana TaxID=38151 RepID=A0A1B6CZM6_9HEMI
MAVQLWGELPELPIDWDKVVPKDIGKLIILNAIKPELPKPKQPTPDENTKHTFQVISPEHSMIEENVSKTIQLIQYNRKLKKRIHQLLSNNEPTPDDLKETTIITELVKQKNKQKYHPRSMENKESAFTLGDTIVLPALGSIVSKDILYKSVAALVAHAGFDSAMECTLQVLVDIVEDYIKRFTSFLRIAVDREEVNGNTGFPDVMERVFFDMRIGSVLEVHKYYQSKVLNRLEEVKISCKRDLETCNKLQEKKLYLARKSPDNQLRLKQEIVDEEDIPEIHFPAMGDGDGVDELQPSLEPGFQMLHSLEQEVQLQSGTKQDEDEDVMKMFTWNRQ